MARGRPRKDGSKPKEKEVEPDPDMNVDGARSKRKAATACIKSVMNRYNINPNDVKKDDTEPLASDNDNSSKLVKSQSSDNEPSDQVSKRDETAGGVSEEAEKTPHDAKCDVISAEKPSPSKNWAQSIWGSPSSSGSVVKPPVDDLKEEPVPHQEMCSGKKNNTMTEKQTSSSSGIKAVFLLLPISVSCVITKVQPPPQVAPGHPEVRPRRWRRHRKSQSRPPRKVKQRSGDGSGH